ncbi:TonB-dependent hemin, ferrichrome receptor [Candidatus Rhodobacter oscarellae]|uniref:TonB-dependent hemin, ferrichrome receptor n=1 Tax=Candidatus Rhodobacter oscarellae TaxID=1675527 RepID=A0A0J9E4K7_9RHOB|nr:TonB-dependent hemin, ferrichrome receptor [Candidatus Rhodobacter lobularis]
MALVAAAPLVSAQSVDLGTIILGESRRDVQTDTAVPVTVVDQKELNDRQADTIAELVDSVPGVTLVNGSTPQGSGINIRGFGANSTFGSDQKVLILVDGATTGAEEIYRIGTQLFTDPALYKSVTVTRGSVGGFEYGTGVIGGLVQLETKDASDFTGGEIGFRFNQTLQYDTNDQGAATSSIIAWQPDNNLEFLANYAYRESNDATDGGGNTIGNSSVALPSYLVKGAYTFGDGDAHRLVFSYSDTSAQDRDVPYDTFMTTAGVFGNVDRDTQTKTAVLSYRYNPADNDLIDLEVDLTHADQQIDSIGVSGQTSPRVVPLVNADHRYRTTKLTVKNNMFFTTGNVDHDLRIGAEAIRKVRLDASSAPGGTDNRFAVFAVDDMSFGNFELTPALRYETSRIVGSTAPNDGTFENDALVGGISAKYNFASGFSVFGSAAYTENLPIIDDLGNVQLMEQSEKSRSVELGFSFDNGNGLAAKVNAYDTRLWDVTSYRGFSVAQHIQEVDMRGVEVEVSYAADSGTYVDLNANFSNGAETTRASVERRWRQSPADSVQLTLGRKFENGWDASWEAVVAASIDFGRDHIPGYSVHNLRTTWAPQEGPLEGAEFRFGIENVLDRDYRPGLSSRNAPGRTFVVTVMKTF